VQINFVLTGGTLRAMAIANTIVPEVLGIEAAAAVAGDVC
jgi:tRNA G37 N-methylase TrmD